MRIVIVDDSPSVRDARQLWLREATDAQVDALDFEGALALGTRWGQVDIAVLDGHDRRSPERRAAAARRSGVDSIPAHDHFPGARLAQEVRRHTPAGVTSIILISAYARENELISRRIVEAGPTSPTTGSPPRRKPGRTRRGRCTPPASRTVTFVRAVT